MAAVLTDAQDPLTPQTAAAASKRDADASSGAPSPVLPTQKAKRKDKLPAKSNNTVKAAVYHPNANASSVTLTQCGHLGVLAATAHRTGVIQLWLLDPVSLKPAEMPTTTLAL